jgi:hypothetical protein
LRGAPTGIFEGNDEDYSMGTVQQPAAKTAVVSTAQSTLDKEREQAKLQGKEFLKGLMEGFILPIQRLMPLFRLLCLTVVFRTTQKTTQRRFLQTGLPVPVTLGMQTKKTWKTAVENLLQAILMLEDYPLCTAMFLAADLET